MLISKKTFLIVIFLFIGQPLSMAVEDKKSDTGTMTREEYREAVAKANEELEAEGLTQEEAMNIGEVLAAAKRSYLRGESARGRGFNRTRFGDDVNQDFAANAVDVRSVQIETGVVQPHHDKSHDK